MKLPIDLLIQIPALYEEAKRKEKDGIVYVKVMTAQQFKTDRQNRLFHSLLQTFLLSGCSSFKDFDDMKSYYKNIAGLISIFERNGHTVEKEKSWGEATKPNAKIAIDAILRDMDTSGVLGSHLGKKYEEILKMIGIWY